MADRSALSMLGFILSGIATMVVVIAFLVVQNHVEAHAALDAYGPTAVSSIR